MTKLNMLLSFAAVSLITIFYSYNNQGQLKVLQINCWHGSTSVENGFRGLVHIIKKTDPDLVLLSEIQGSKGVSIIDQLVDTLSTLGVTYYGETRGGSAGLISKHKFLKTESCCTTDSQGPMTKVHLAIHGQAITVYAAHLDYKHYECYLPRGYSGTTWKKLDAPVLDVAQILQANRLSQRDETIADFIQDAKKELIKGNLVLLGGDFNEPSHLDWQMDTQELRDHNGLVIDWDCSVMLSKMGMVDTFREKYPNPVTHPGFTFPSANAAAKTSQLTWAPEADERERIDFIYYYPNKNWKLDKVSLVGPKETIIRGQTKAHDSKDSFILPEDVWPSDHKAQLATFFIEKD